MLLHGDCKEMMGLIVGENSIDALITDPPAGIAFMGKDWDKDKGGRDAWIKWMSGVMEECYRVMKPGAHGFVWALPRTSHWTATACENAGFEIRDVVMHVFGTGFPKSLNVSKAIDKAKGAKRKVVGTYETLMSRDGSKRLDKKSNQRPFQGSNTKKNKNAYHLPITAPATFEAKQWDGWGTALKPAAEHWVLIRKPFDTTVAKNVLEHGTGAINIDASRVEGDIGPDRAHGKPRRTDNTKYGKSNEVINPQSPFGRFPANFICSGEARDVLDEQSGECKTGALKPYKEKGKSWFTDHETRNVHHVASTGGASRFFYCAKASKAERNAGCEGMEEKQSFMKGLPDLRMKQEQARIGNQNHHPTVKAQKLMRYLCNMITPPGGTILDPFAGSGSTGVAAVTDGFEFIGIEQEQEYFDIAHARIEEAENRRSA